MDETVSSQAASTPLLVSGVADSTPNCTATNKVSAVANAAPSADAALTNQAPTKCSMSCSDYDSAAQTSAFMTDAAPSSPSTVALLDVAIPGPNIVDAEVLDGGIDSEAWLKARPMLDAGGVIFPGTLVTTHPVWVVQLDTLPVGAPLSDDPTPCKDRLVVVQVPTHPVSCCPVLMEIEADDIMWDCYIQRLDILPPDRGKHKKGKEAMAWLPPWPLPQTGANHKLSDRGLINELDESLLLVGSSDGKVRRWRNYTQKGGQKLVTAFSSVHCHRAAGRGIVIDWQQQYGYLNASGNLAKKKIFPALFALYYEDCLPRHFTIFGYARSKMTDAELRNMVSKTLTCRIDKRENCSETMEEFLKRCFYHSDQYDTEKHFMGLDKKLKQHEGSRVSNRLFYLSIPPNIFLEVVKCASNSASSANGWARVIVEKPFGRDSDSSAALTRGLKQYLVEDQIFRIDHYLEKELVENLSVLRFSNLVFEPLWSRQYIRCVQLIFSEDFGTEGRGVYTNGAGLEVKPGQTVKCEPEDDHFLHLSQAALEESKKGSDSALMYVKVDDPKHGDCFQATIDRRLPKNVHGKIRAMELTLTKIKQVHDHCQAAIDELLSTLHTTEGQLEAHKQEAKYVAQIAAKALPKGSIVLHCSLRMSIILPAPTISIFHMKKSWKTRNYNTTHYSRIRYWQLLWL